MPSDIVDYFNLNQRSKVRGHSFASIDFERVREQPSAVELGDGSSRKEVSEQREDSARMSVCQQIGIYSGVPVGVVLNVMIDHLRQTKRVYPSVLWEILLCFIIAFAIVPYVWEKLQINPAVPFIVKFGLFVQNGFFWSAILGSVNIGGQP
jgi:hypothetical protein